MLFDWVEYSGNCSIFFYVDTLRRKRSIGFLQIVLSVFISIPSLQEGPRSAVHTFGYCHERLMDQSAVVRNGSTTPDNCIFSSAWESFSKFRSFPSRANFVRRYGVWQQVSVSPLVLDGGLRKFCGETFTAKLEFWTASCDPSTLLFAAVRFF